MYRKAPDRDWEPAVRDDASKQSSDYQRIMEELQSRELGPDDYEILLQLEQKESNISQHRFLAQAFEKAFKAPAEYFQYPKAYCAFCELEIVDRDTGTQLKQCDHHVHKPCLEDILRTKNECPLCEQKILLGYDKCLNSRKMPKVVKKKQTLDQNLRLAIIKETEAEQAAMSFGVSGKGIAEMT